MKYTNDLREKNGKWYARLEYSADDTIPKGCYYLVQNFLHSFNVTSEPVKMREYIRYGYIIYAPVEVPEGFSVLKDGDSISSKTLIFLDGRLVQAPVAYHGCFSRVTERCPNLPSILMFNPPTPQEYFTNAEKSGIVNAFKDGKTIQSSRDGENWIDEPTPNFCSPLQWRVKSDPIKPPVFDWRPIDEYDLKDNTLVIIKSHYGSVLTAYCKNKTWYCNFSGESFVMSPTHFTVTE